MTRPLRCPVADGWYHVFGRGIERRPIFSEPRDREHFLELAAECTERFCVRLHAYVLMDNHYHAVLQTPEANLSAVMQWVHGSYSSWYNVKHDRVGPLLLECTHREVAHRPAAYRLAARRLLSQGVEAPMAERLRDAVAIGSAAFAAHIRRASATSTLEGITGKRELRQRVPVEAVRRATEAIMGAPWKVFGDAHGNWGGALFLWGVRRCCGLTLREAGKQAGGMSVTAVSAAIRRLDRRAAADVTLRAWQARLIEMSKVEP